MGRFGLAGGISFCDDYCNAANSQLDMYILGSWCRIVGIPDGYEKTSCSMASFGTSAASLGCNLVLELLHLPLRHILLLCLTLVAFPPLVPLPHTQQLSWAVVARA